MAIPKKMNLQPKLNWRKYVARKADLQKSLQFGQGTGFQFHKFFGTKNIVHHLYYFDGRTTLVYFDKNDFAEFTKSFIKKLEDLDFIKSYKNRALKICERTLSEAEMIIKVLANNPNKSALVDSFNKFNDVWKLFYPVGWAAFYLTNLETIVEKKLVKIFGDEPNAEDVLKLIVHPTTLTPIMSSEIDLLRLAQDMKVGGKNLQKIAFNMAEKYGWMSVYNFDDNPRNHEYYIEEAQKIIESGTNILKKIKELENDRKENENKFQVFTKTIGDKLLKEQVKLLHILGYLRDKREEIRDRLSIFARQLYEKIGESTNLELGDIIYLSNEEIVELLSVVDDNRVSELRRIAQARQKRFLFLIDDDEVHIIDEENTIKKYLQELPQEKEVETISGQVAFKQKDPVRGRAKIVFSNKELGKVKNGDVLVVTMTKPDFIGAMKKAIAFVTDEGGITCHAAIVARELKKPCIVGTKIATQVLHDGDLVEVDAERGIVTILKKADANNNGKNVSQSENKAESRSFRKGGANKGIVKIIEKVK